MSAATGAMSMSETISPELLNLLIVDDERAVREGCREAGCKIGETPILFENRKAGDSKVNPWEAARSMSLLIRLGLGAMFGEGAAPRRPAPAVPITLCVSDTRSSRRRCGEKANSDAPASPRPVSSRVRRVSAGHGPSRSVRSPSAPSGL